METHRQTQILHKKKRKSPLRQLVEELVDEDIKKQLKRHNLQLETTINTQIKEKNRKSCNVILDYPFVLNSEIITENKDFLYIDKSILGEKKEKKKRGRPKKDTSIIVVKPPNKRRWRFNSVYENLLRLILAHRALYLHEIQRQFPQIKERSLVRYLNELWKLKWIYKFAKGYYLNPFLGFLLKNTDDFRSILEYVNYKIDLFRLLNYPLRLINNPVDFETKIVWQLKLGSRESGVLNHYPRMGPLFFGFLFVYAKLLNGMELQTFLPINVHSQHAFQNDIPHICIPVDWSLFDIDSSTTYSGETYVHFDNSITLSYHQRKFYFRKGIIKTTELWSGEGNFYLETYDPETIEKLFTLRYKHGLRRKQLFEAMGIKQKSMKWKKRGK